MLLYLPRMVMWLFDNNGLVRLNAPLEALMEIMVPLNKTFIMAYSLDDQLLTTTVTINYISAL